MPHKLQGHVLGTVLEWDLGPTLGDPAAAMTAPLDLGVWASGTQSLESPQLLLGPVFYSMVDPVSSPIGLGS